MGWMKLRWALFGLAVLAAATTFAAPAEAQQGAFCQNASKTCGAMLSPECRRVGAGSSGAPSSEQAGCDGEFQQYRQCLAEAATLCGPTSAAGVKDAPQVAGAEQLRVARYCQGELDHCLETAEESYTDCSDAADSDCRGDCQAERVRVRERCNDNHRSCLTLETFNTVSFQEPSCVMNTRGGDGLYPTGG